GPPADIVARKSGFNEIATPEQLNLAYPNTCIVSTASAVSRNDDLTRRIMRAMVEGIHFFKTQKEASMKSLDAFARLGDAGLIDETYRHYQDIIPRVPYPESEGYSECAQRNRQERPQSQEFQTGNVCRHAPIERVGSDRLRSEPIPVAAT